jgi:predicted amidohydrolase YtcJ
MHKLNRAVAIFALLFGMQPSVRAVEPAPDLIYHGGTIVTVNELQPTVEAVAVRGGRIVAVGYRDEVMKRKGPNTKVIDLAGKTMIPGLIDAHGHVFATGIQALSANLLAPPDGEGSEEPDGVLEEAAWFGSLSKVLGKLGPAEDVAILKAGTELYASFGYTTAQEGRGRPSGIATMAAAAKKGSLKIDVVVYSDIIGAADTIKPPVWSRNCTGRSSPT